MLSLALSREIPIRILKVHPNAIIPEYKNPGDAGMDLYSCEDVTIGPGQTVGVRTGLKVAIPYGYELQIRPRSGLSLRTPLRVANSPGTIDSGYRDEIIIIITNTLVFPFDCDVPTITLGIDECKNEYGKYVIPAGTRIAQLVLTEVPRVKWLEVADENEILEFESDIHKGLGRGGGLGSTGLK